VVKSVRWRLTDPKPTLFAAVGNDCDLHVCDVRTKAIHLHKEGVHSQAICAVEWSPTNEHLLMTSGLDKFVNLFDIRHTKEPVRLFHWNQHQECLKGKSSICRPVFSRDGTHVVVSGENSDKIYSFSVTTGALDSCKYVGFSGQSLKLSPRGHLFASQNKMLWQIPPGKF
jgi:WD40 repeat protein